MSRLKLVFVELKINYFLNKALKDSMHILLQFVNFGPTLNLPLLFRSNDMMLLQFYIIRKLPGSFRGWFWWNTIVYIHVSDVMRYITTRYKVLYEIWMIVLIWSYHRVCLVLQKQNSNQRVHIIQSFCAYCGLTCGQETWILSNNICMLNSNFFVFCFLFTQQHWHLCISMEYHNEY